MVESEGYSVLRISVQASKGVKSKNNVPMYVHYYTNFSGSLKAAASTSLSSEIDMDRLAPPANMIEKSGSLEIIPENCSLDPSGRLSISLDDKNVSSPDSCGSPNQPCR